VKKSGVPVAMRLQVEKHAANITKRGAAAAERKRAEEEADNKPSVSPWVVYLFVFIIVGSAILQIISTASSKGIV